MSFARFVFGPLALGMIMATTGCDNTLALPPATAANILDTVTLHALEGTSISDPSGFNLVLARAARTDRPSEPFDFAFDLDAQEQAVMFTTGALGLPDESAIQLSEDQFEDITIAPLEDYDPDNPLVVDVDDVFIVRSRFDPTGCAFYLGQLPRYGKFRVLTIDLATRQIVLENVVNINCGYRSLELGVPTR